MAKKMTEAKSAATLKAGTWRREGDEVVVCFDRPKGVTRIL